MKRALLRWVLFIVVVALVAGCSSGMEVKGSGGSDEGADDDSSSTEPPPAPIDCWRDQGDLSIILIYWQYDPSDFDLVDNFAIRRKEEGSDEWETIAEPEPDTGTAYQQYEDESAECDITYYYRIYAVNSAGYSDYCPLSAIRNCE